MNVDFDRKRAAELYRQAAVEVEAGKYREAEQSVSIAHMYVSALKRHDPQPPAPPTTHTVPIAETPAPAPAPSPNDAIPCNDCGNTHVLGPCFRKDAEDTLES